MMFSESDLVKFCKMTELVCSYDLSENVKQALITYFEKWMSGVGLFNGEDLHATRVRSLITELISFHCTDEEMVAIIRTCTVLELTKFFCPRDLDMVYDIEVDWLKKKEEEWWKKKSEELHDWLEYRCKWH